MSNTTIQETIVSELKGKGLPFITAIENPFVSVLPISNFE